MNSIRRRLSLGLALSLVALFVLLGLGVSYSFRLLTEAYILSRLEHDSESLLTALMPDTDARLQLQEERIDPVYAKPFSGHYYIVSVAERELRSRSLWDQTLTVPAVTPGEVVAVRLTGPQEQLLLLRVAGYRKAGQALTIAVAEDLSPIRAHVRQFQLRYALFGGAALLLLLAVQRWMLDRGLQPLETTCREIGELERGERTQLGEQVPGEILPVVRKVNHLLTVMQQRLTRSRHALGNLAHALKTPLTLLTQLSDRDDLFHQRADAERLRDQLERIRELTDRELKRARLAGPAGAQSRQDLAVELPALVHVLQQLYRARDLRISLDVPAQLPLPIDREDLHELLGNLLDNACKWARRQVRVTAAAVTAPAPGVQIAIEDDGPGISAAELTRLRERGVRRDEDGVPGHGLGLAIVQEILEHYGGDLQLQSDAALGGLRAQLWLPAAPA